MQLNIDNAYSKSATAPPQGSVSQEPSGANGSSWHSLGLALVSPPAYAGFCFFFVMAAYVWVHLVKPFNKYIRGDDYMYATLADCLLSFYECVLVTAAGVLGAFIGRNKDVPWYLLGEVLCMLALASSPLILQAIRANSLPPTLSSTAPNENVLTTSIGV